MENGAGGFTSDWKYPRWLSWALVIIKPLQIEQTVVFTYLLLLMSTILSKH
jgi:hypothetical protein